MNTPNTASSSSRIQAEEAPIITAAATVLSSQSCSNPNSRMPRSSTGSGAASTEEDGDTSSHNNQNWNTTNDVEFPSDDNSSHASSTWSSSTQPHRSSLSSSQGGGRESFQQQKRHSHSSSAPLPPPVLVYHDSARSIVFRDDLHRACDAAARRSSEVVADIFVGSMPSPRMQSQSERTTTGGQYTTRHASFVSERPAGTASMTTTARRAHSAYYVPGHDGENITPLVSDTTSSSRSSMTSVESRHQSHELIVPLPRLELSRNDEFRPLLVSDESQHEDYWTTAEREVYRRMIEQTACVKTIGNQDWTDFLTRFTTPKDPNNGERKHRNPRDDIGPSTTSEGKGDSNNDDDGTDTDNFPYTSFVTSTTLLPSGGTKMRAYGSTSKYTTGVVFALPDYPTDNDEEAVATTATQTWCWPAGYSAKTEFNIDSQGGLLNGRADALVSLATLRRNNHEYVTHTDYKIGDRLVPGGLHQVPYNEVFLRVGGRGRRPRPTNDEDDTNITNTTAARRPRYRSFDKGVGLPVALFCRTASFGHLFSLLRTRARMISTFGEAQMQGLPLVLIAPDISIRILTESLQQQLLKVAASELNPFQNPQIAHHTKIDHTEPACMQTKLEELIDLSGEHDKLCETLTHHELVRIAGGFGATDESVAKILRDAMIHDTTTATTTTSNKQQQSQHRIENDDDDNEDIEAEGRHALQDIVNEGLAASVRASDYYTSRQLLILYSLVSSEGQRNSTDDDKHQHDTALLNEGKAQKANHETSTLDISEMKLETKEGQEDGPKNCSALLDSKAMLLKYKRDGDPDILTNVKKSLVPRPPPPPLDTDRLRSATNSDGLLAVLGAAQILKAMQDGGAKRRTKESWEAVEEWIEHGERNIAFRLASWRDLRSAQNDLEIAVDESSSFMAFVSGKAISNRKKFAQQLHQAVPSIEHTDFNNMRFLLAIDEITNRMNSPCLRLELLQYVLGLDNRYSIAHLKRAVELAATCLNISAYRNE